MTSLTRLDGAVPLDLSSTHDQALTALTRRVADLEQRLNVMKVIIGLVLAGKMLLVVAFFYLLFGHGFVVRDGPVHSTSQQGRSASLS